MGALTRSSSAFAAVALAVVLFSTIACSALDSSIISYEQSHLDKSSPAWRSDEEAMSMFESWLVRHGKNYNALGEREKRFVIFKDNLRFIDQHNSESHTYKLGLNKFADLTNDEYRSKYLGAKTDPRRRFSKPKTTSRYAFRAGDSLPDSVDWRKEGAVAGVKDQGSCAKMSNTESLEEEVEFLRNDDHELWGASDSDDPDFDPSNFAGKYYGAEFLVDQKWETREELVDWAKNRGKELMMVLVIRRSNVRHVTLTCELYGEHRSGKKKNRDIVVANEDIEEERWVRSKRKGCGFELRGFRERKTPGILGIVDNQKWVLSVVCGEHNHMLDDSFEGHAIIGRLTPEQQLMVRRLGKIFVPPSDIVAQLQAFFPGNVTSSKQVSNYLQRINYEDRGEMSVTQWTLNFMKEHRYEVFPLREIATNEMDILFFAHPDSLHLFKRFPYVIVIDATYKTNRYNMPLVEIVGFTCTNKTFNIAFAFTRKEEVVHYTFIMQKLLYLCNEAGVMPTAIMTDRDLALINAIHIVFPPTVKHLLCWVHINRNIEAYANPILKDKEAVETFCGQCWGLFCSVTEESYNERLEKLKSSKKKGLVRYVLKVWLNPYKENIVRAWTDHHLHFVTRTSNRVEGMHRVLKKIVDSSIGGFNRMIVRIHHQIQGQISKVRASMEDSRIKKPLCFNKMPPEIRVLFSRLFFKVSDKGLRKLYDMYQLLVEDEFTDECDDYWVRECLGLPCIHDIGRAIMNKTPIVPSDIHPFWKQLEWGRIVCGPHHDIQDDNVTMSIGELRMREMVQMFERGELRKSTMDQVGELLYDLEKPKESSMREPTELPPKGRPVGSGKYSTKRNPSHFEYTRADLEKHEKDKAQGKVKSKAKGKPRGRPPTPVQTTSSPVDCYQYEPCVTQDPEETEPYRSAVMEQPIIHLGIDFGVRNIDYFWYPYIKEARDVRDDGHCGYRSLAVLLRYDEENYSTIRFSVASHMLDNEGLYQPILDALQPGVTVRQIVGRVNHIQSPCSRAHWLHMPMIGLAFATIYQVALAFLSWDGPCLCLPMIASMESHGHPLNLVTMAHVGQRNHFIPVVLRDESPIPPTPYAWRQFKHGSVDGWDVPYYPRMMRFEEYRTENGRPPTTMA